MADNLREILDIARREMPDVPHDVWARLETVVRLNFGTQRPYIAAMKKRYHLEALAQMDLQQTATSLAAQLGLRVDVVRRAKRLIK